MSALTECGEELSLTRGRFATTRIVFGSQAGASVARNRISKLRLQLSIRHVLTRPSRSIRNRATHY